MTTTTPLTSEKTERSKQNGTARTMRAARLDLQDNDTAKTLQTLAGRILAMEDISAILVPLRLPGSMAVMPTLVNDPQRLSDADLLAPAFPLNAARIVSRLTRKPFKGKVAVWLRPCEIRAFVELVKLHQCSNDNLVIIASDCLGAFTNTDYATFAQAAGPESTRHFCDHILSGKGGAVEGVELASACRACISPLPDGADIAVMLHGAAGDDHLILAAQTPNGLALLDQLALPSASEPTGRAAAVQSVIEERQKYREQLFEQTRNATDSLEKLAVYLSRCVNCYNCRVACPVCYCRECVFLTDVFDHDPSQYLEWGRRHGVLKMPTDTLFFHLTRLAHMSTACVGCGQCDNACPNDIKVMALFNLVASRTQAAFGYQAGRSVDEAPPLSIFREKELDEVVGLK